LANSVIAHEENTDHKIKRLMTLGEFEKNVFDNVNKDQSELKKVCDIFSNFNPGDDKHDYALYLLVWRILVIHACIYWVINHIRKKDSFGKSSTENKDKKFVKRIEHLIESFMKDEVEKFSWIVKDIKRQPPYCSKQEENYEKKKFNLSKKAIEGYLEYWLRNNIESSTKENSD
jgi:hypothetical protein